MQNKYYLILVGFVLSVVLFLLIIIISFTGFVPQEFMNEFITIIPGFEKIPGMPQGVGIYSDLIILYLLPVLIILLIIAISPLTIKFFYKTHKLINRKAVYGIMDLKAYSLRYSRIQEFRDCKYSVYFLFSLIPQFLNPLIPESIGSFITKEIQTSIPREKV